MARARLSTGPLLVVLAAAALGTATARAEDVPLACPEARDAQFILPKTRRPPLAADEPASVRAERAHGTPGGPMEFSGRVELERGSQRLTSDLLTYDPASDIARARGNVELSERSGESYRTEEATLHTATRTGTAAASQFHLERNHARGEAAAVEFAGPDLTRLRRVGYTTCDPGQDDWFLRIGELEIDTAEDVGTAYHTSVEFFGVPVFYFPYINFPIGDQRKSGFLIPRAGYTSQSGAVLATPYYFNLAPNYDDTLTPRLLTDRGLQLQNEFRYLTPGSQGKLDLEGLGDDRKYGDDRAAAAYKHLTRFTPGWSGTIDARWVSDDKYLDDFGDHLGITSQTHLPQTAELNYNGPLWRFTTRAAAYQTVDPTIADSQRPYQRLPQLALTLNPRDRPNQLQPDFYAEVTRFDHSVLLTGERANLNPAVSLPLTVPYASLTPKLGAWYLGYNLDRPEETTPQRSLGYGSLDGRLFFERDTDWFGRGLTQTLEPRLYYLYVPYREQDELPLFDTSVPDFSFGGLFRDNRFVGGDRFGDANQVTAALTTRLVDHEDGTDRLALSLGRIFYLDDRRVNLPAGTVERARSDYAAEVSAWLVGNWYARGTVQWNPETDAEQRHNYYLQYQPARDKIVNLGHSFQRDQIRQRDVSFEWPLASRWALLGRSLYSERDRRNLETYAGVQYHACCWALRLYANRHYSQSEGQVNGFMFELQLTGLGRAGGIPNRPRDQGVFTFAPPAAGPGQFDP